MANRTIIGTRGTDVGIFISKPGIDVLTAAEQDLLLSTSQPSLQFVQMGSITFSSAGNIDVAIPDQGFAPVCLWSVNYGSSSTGANGLEVRYFFPSNSLMRVFVDNTGIGTIVFCYGIIRMPVDAF